MTTILILFSSIAFGQCLDLFIQPTYRVVNERELSLMLSSALTAIETQVEDHYQAFKSYKNSPNDKPITVSLDSAEIFQNSTELQELASFDRELSNPKMELSHYDLALLKLKKGDSIRFGDEVFILGKFLGRGNVSHVYELANQKNKVIKLPFLSKHIRASREARVQNLPFSAKNVAEMMHGLFQFTLQHFKQAEPLPVDLDAKGRFALVEKVNGQESGFELIGTRFLLKALLEQKRLKESSEIDNILVLDLAPIVITENRERKKVISLFKEMQKRKELVLSSDPDADKIVLLSSRIKKYDRKFSVVKYHLKGFGDFYMNSMVSRQYLYDVVKQAWIKVDSERAETPIEQLENFSKQYMSSDKFPDL